MSENHLNQHPRVAVKSNGSQFKPAPGVGAAGKVSGAGGMLAPKVPTPQSSGDHTSNSVRLGVPPRTSERGGQPNTGHFRGSIKPGPSGSKDKANVPKSGKPKKDIAALKATGAI